MTDKLTYTLTLQEIQPITHDTVHMTFDRPAGYDWIPGQANHWNLPIDGFRDAGKPFTMINLPSTPGMEFIVKVYDTEKHPDHDGFTEQLGMMRPGDIVTVDEPSGDIRDEGSGVFIAGGAGITPMIAILRKRQANGGLDGCTLIFSNKTEQDIIWRGRFQAMEGLRTIFTTTEERAEGLHHGEVDADFINDTVGFDNRFYVCGPPPMMKGVIADLREHGVPEASIVVEKKWLS